MGQIVKNLYVVFIMNLLEDGLSFKVVMLFVLFNCCVFNWFGDWFDQVLFQVGYEFMYFVDLDRLNWVVFDIIFVVYCSFNLLLLYREVVVNFMVYIYYLLQWFNSKFFKQQGKVIFFILRYFLDFVVQYVKLYNEKREDLEE